MDSLFITGCLSFSITFVTVFIIRPLAIKLNLVDRPNSRKLHHGAVPLIGGIAIFLAVFLVTICIYPIQQKIIAFLLAITLIILTGVLDDRFDLKVSIRLLIQALSAVILMIGSGLSLKNLGNLFGSGVIHLGAFGIIFTIIAVIGAINAYNMVDGIDGLAGILSIISFGSQALLLGAIHSEWTVIPIIFIGALLAYLVFNLKWPIKKLPKVFMGDAGSMLIGLSIVWLLIIGTQSKNIALNPTTALWTIAIPLMDMASTMTRRMIHGRSPFHADRTHLHHILMRSGLSPKQTLFIISTGAIFFAGIGIIFEKNYITEEFSILTFLLVFTTYNILILALNRFAKEEKITSLKSLIGSRRQ